MKQDEAKLGLSMSGNGRIGICHVQYLYLPWLTKTLELNIIA